MPDQTASTTPDLNGLNQPGPATSSTMESVAPPNLTEAGAPAYGEPGAAQQPSTVVPVGAPTSAQPVAPPVRHKALLSMVQGLADGLSAAGKSISTHGREGGAAEVQQLQAGRQQMKQSAQAAASAQVAADTENKLKQATTNQINANVHNLIATFPDEVAQSHMKTAEMGLATQQKAQEVFDTTGRIPTGWSADPTTGQVTQGTQSANAAPGAGTPTAPSMYDRRAGIILDAVGKELADEKGNEDPSVIAARNVFANPASTIAQKQQTLVALQAKAGMNTQVMKNLTEKADLKLKQEAGETGGVVGKLSTPEALAAPGAQAAIQAQIDNPNTTAKEVSQLRTLLPQAAVAQLNAETMKQREQRNQQIVNQGDPDIAGKSLADRTLTLDELKSRAVTPEFIVAATNAAKKYDPHFKAPEAAAQARIAGSPANSQFFGNTDSLLVRGGTLDQLAQAHVVLGNMKLPFVNKLDNWTKAAVGSGPQAAFAASALGVADDYSKVISGGAGSDSSRQQALDIIGRDLSSEGMAAAIRQIRSTVTSQRNGRISTNPYMQSMYPDPTTRQEAPGIAGTQKAAPRTAPAGVPAGSKLMQVPGGTPHWISPDKIAEAQKLNATEVQ